MDFSLNIYSLGMGIPELVSKYRVVISKGFFMVLFKNLEDQ